MHRLRSFWLCLLTLVFATPVLAVDPTQDPYTLVEEATGEVMTVIDNAQDYYEEEPERFYNQISDIMEDVVDFGSFARGVMGPYASKKRYVALDSAAEREQFKQQIREFTEVFKEGLIQTYAKGLLTFNGGKIEVERPEDAGLEDGSVVVTQYITGQDGERHVIHYKLRRYNNGAWKLRNVVIDGINLGLTYRNQFAAAARDYEGDIDRVIANWSVNPDEDLKNGERSDDSEVEMEG